MQLAAWKYFSVIMALVLVLGTGVTALVPAAPAAADNALTHGQATDNTTGKSRRGPSENRTHPFPGLSQSSGMKSVFTAPAPGTTYYVNGDSGLNTNSGTALSPWKTIQYALDTVAANNTIHVVGIRDTVTHSYEEALTISKNVTIIGDGMDTTELWVNVGSSTISLTGSGLDVSISGMWIHHNNSWSINGAGISAADSTLTLNNVDLWGAKAMKGAAYMLTTARWLRTTAGYPGRRTTTAAA